MATKVVKKKDIKSVKITKPSTIKSKEELVVYHNNRCSKSREVCGVLEKHSVSYKTIEYLKNSPSIEQLKELLQMLGIKAEDLVRKKEPLYKEKFATKKLTETQWIKVLSENPVLIERPILIKNNKAIIGRPIEKAIEFIQSN